MNPTVSEWMNLVFRWLHVVAGVMWIGHLWFFNFVNAQVAKSYDADSKKKVVPELMPRALYFFRWGAAWTWVTGVLLFGIVYSMGGVLVTPESTTSPMAASGIVLGAWVVAFLVYDLLWKSPLAKNEMAGALVSLVGAVGIAFALGQVITGRGLYIAMGGLFGTIMAANVWMRIWPAQRKIIAGIAGTGPAADASVPAMAGLRSKHNTYLSMPLMLLMVSNHFPTAYGSQAGVAIFAGIVVVGWALTKYLYGKSATPAPKAF